MKYTVTRTQTITVTADHAAWAIDLATAAFYGDSDPDQVQEEWEVGPA